MKIFLRTISMLGVLIMLFGISTIAMNSWSNLYPPQHPSGLDFATPFGAGEVVFSIVLMLTFGFIRLAAYRETSRYLWWILIILGLLFLFSFYGYVRSWNGRIRDDQIGVLFVDLSFMIIPSLMAIIGGLLLKRISDKKKAIYKT